MQSLPPLGRHVNAQQACLQLTVHCTFAHKDSHSAQSLLPYFATSIHKLHCKQSYCKHAYHKHIQCKHIGSNPTSGVSVTGRGAPHPAAVQGAQGPGPVAISGPPGQQYGAPMQQGAPMAQVCSYATYSRPLIPCTFNREPKARELGWSGVQKQFLSFVRLLQLVLNCLWSVSLCRMIDLCVVQLGCDFTYAATIGVE